MGNPVVHFEIMAPDKDTLYKFYSELFGWHVEMMPMGAGMEYGIVDTHSGGKGINGGMGAPPDDSQVVMIYIEADDLQAVLDKAESLGGKTSMPVAEVPGVVTLAQFLDPQGNRIGLVKSDPTQQDGTPSQGSNPPVTWFEILGTDGKALRDFYSKLLGWKIREVSDSEIDYGHIEPQGKGIGGGIGASPMGQPAVTVYVEVEDLQKYLDRAESLGGKTMMPPMDAGNVSFAQFADPTGNVVGLWKPLD